MVDFRRTRRALAIFSALAAAGCQSAKVDDLAPQSFVAPKNTGEFPKIGHIPVAETAQLDAGGAAALRGQLSSARASQAASADSPEPYAEKLRRLRLLQARHAADTIAEIEARKPE
jgi:hypothetical protein